jgi:hypothetical protein
MLLESNALCDGEIRDRSRMAIHDVENPGLKPALARRRSSGFELTAAERKLLKDPDWIDEEEADLIFAMREEKEHGLRGENLLDFARRHGRNPRT